MLYSIKRFISRCRVRMKYPRVVLGRATDVSVASAFEGAEKIGPNTRFDGQMGHCSYIGGDCYINELKIGRYCSISAFVRVYTGELYRYFEFCANTFRSFYDTAQYVRVQRIPVCNLGLTSFIDIFPKCRAEALFGADAVKAGADV